MVLGQPVGDIERRGSLAKSGGGFGAGSSLGPQDSYLPIQNGAGPTIPARWDDSQRYSNAYSDSDTHNYATDYFDTTSPSHAGAARPTPPSVNSTA